MRALLFLFLSGLITVSLGDERGDRLARARQAITQGKDRQAISDLEWLVKNSRSRAEGEEGAVLLIESALRLGDWKKAEAQIERFQIYNTKSIHYSRVEWAQARLMLKNGELLNSALLMSRLLSRPLSAELRSEIRVQFQRLLDSGLLGQLELETLLNHSVADVQLSGELLFRLANVFEKEERWKGATYFYRWLIHEFPNHPKASLAAERISALSGKDGGKPIIVFLAPLTGEYASFGNDLLQGGLLALEMYGGDNAIGWRAVDSRAQPADALLALQQILSQENVLAVVGPVMSPVATTVGAWISLAAPHIPLVIPVASAEGISKLGHNIFQLTPPTSELARTIARYAMECLGHREFAVLAPRTPYGETISSAFVDEVERGGGTLLGVEQYEEGLPDYKKHFETLRLKGYKLLRERRLIAAGVEDLSDRGGAKARTAYLADSVITVDAVLIAASTPGDAIQLGSQTIFNKINTQLLGTSGWYGAELLKSGRKIMEGSIFSSDFLERSDDPTFVKFFNAYQKRWAMAPGLDRVAGLSYDAVRFVLYANKKPGDALVSKMRSVGRIPGVYGDLFLDPKSGSNQNIHLVGVENGGFKILEGCAK